MTWELFIFTWELFRLREAKLFVREAKLLVLVLLDLVIFTCLLPQQNPGSVTEKGPAVVCFPKMQSNFMIRKYFENFFRHSFPI